MALTAARIDRDETPSAGPGERAAVFTMLGIVAKETGAFEQAEAHYLRERRVSP